MASLTEMPNNNIPDQTSNEYIPLLKEFESKLMDVENAFQSACIKCNWYITTVINEADYDQLIIPGQKANIEIIGKTCRVIKLL